MKVNLIKKLYPLLDYSKSNSVSLKQILKTLSQIALNNANVMNKLKIESNPLTDSMMFKKTAQKWLQASKILDDVADEIDV